MTAPFPQPSPDPRYSVGTLQYTKASLVALFAWLLWGDFCFTLMESVVPAIMPLKLKELGAPNILVGVLLTTLPSAMTMLVNPIIGFRSDRCRTSKGRRLPFLMWAAPPITLFLLLLGFTEDIGSLLHASFFGAYRPAAVTLGVLSILYLGFQFTNLFLASAYSFLLSDVVPRAFLARFSALFRIMGCGAGALFNIQVFPYIGTHSRSIFLGAAALYAFGFTLMCLRVREGQYAPPPEKTKSSGWSDFPLAARTYWKECFTHPVYVYFFLSNALFAMAYCTESFNFYLLNNSLHLSLEQIGKINGFGMVISMFLLYPCGMLADRYNPLRLMIWSKIPANITVAVPILFLFINVEPQTAFYILFAGAVISLPTNALGIAAWWPVLMRVLPRERYGQFYTANSVAVCVAQILGGLGAGALMDLLKTLHAGDDFYYRYTPIWTTVCSILALLCLVQVRRIIEREHGGIFHFVPPEPSTRLASVKSQT